MNKLVYLAPMLDITDRHCRKMLRSISKHLFLYTEMINEHEVNAFLAGKAKTDRFTLEEWEAKIAFQVGGSDKSLIEKTAKLVDSLGYSEFNLNLGCPSPRVQSGAFGAILMKNPDNVIHLIKDIKSLIKIPFSIKIRIGVDDLNTYDFFREFVLKVSPFVDRIIVHCRIALLNFNPKQNRNIPPLKYEFLYDLKKEFPHLHLSLNGGIKTLEEVKNHLEIANGVMIGRALYENPMEFAGIDTFFEKSIPKTRAELIDELLIYANEQVEQGEKLNHITRHWLGLFKGLEQAKKIRNLLTSTKSIDILKKNEKTLYY